MEVIYDCYGDKIPTSAYIIRATEVVDFLNCPLRWGITSHNGLNLEPIETSPKLRFGTIWHTALEWYYSHKPLNAEWAFKGLDHAIEQDRQTQIENRGIIVNTLEAEDERTAESSLLKIMLEGYIPWAMNFADPSDGKLYYHTTEQRYVVPIYASSRKDTPAYLAVKLDAVASQQKSWWVVEHKTIGKSMSADNPEMLDHDLQLGLQILALSKAISVEDLSGAYVRGAIYNLARKQLPGPKVKAPLFGRHSVVRSNKELLLLDEFLYKVFQEMYAFTNNIRQTGELPWRYNPQVYGRCGWGCFAKAICRAKASGGDVQYLLSVHFKPRSKTIWQTLAEEMTND